MTNGTNLCHHAADPMLFIPHHRNQVRSLAKLINGIPHENAQDKARPSLSHTACTSMRALLRIHTYTVAITLSSLISITLLFYTFSGGGIGSGVQGGSIFSNYRRIEQLEHVVQNLKGKLSEAVAYEHELLTKINELQEQVDSEHASTIHVRGLGDRSGWDRVGDIPNGSEGHQIYSCRHTDTIKIGRTIGQGHTKVVQEGTLLGRKVAVKSASEQVKSVKECLQQKIYKKKEDCLILATYKVLKEAMILRQVSHPNIVRLVGLCARSENGSPNIKERGVTLVTELGIPVKLHELVELPWSKRLKVEYSRTIDVDNRPLTVFSSRLLIYSFFSPKHRTFLNRPVS